ncbi:MAG TPA: hydrogenase maturation protease [Bryobacteraceae bacterium]|nr:hydrogenase maturation protease [Bryobacteraceae bacterium]
MVVGYGNPLRQDDGMGLRAAEILEGNGIDVLRCHQLTPDLAADIADSQVAVFLDAAADLEPGAIRCTEVACEPGGAWTHHFTPGQLLRFTAAIFGRAPRAVLITGGAFALDFSEGLTDGGEQCAQRMAEAALLVIGSQLQPCGV